MYANVGAHEAYISQGTTRFSVHIEGSVQEVMMDSGRAEKFSTDSSFGRASELDPSPWAV